MPVVMGGWKQHGHPSLGERRPVSCGASPPQGIVQQKKLQTMSSLGNRHGPKNTTLRENSKKQNKVINALPFAQIKKTPAQETSNHTLKETSKGNGSGDGKELKAREIAGGGGKLGTVFPVTLYGRERI